jgi:hypothetical protein
MLLNRKRRGSIDDLLKGPQRSLTSEEIERETEQLLTVCARKGVTAVACEVADCRELLRCLANACHLANLTSAGQYLDYLDSPY